MEIIGILDINICACFILIFSFTCLGTAGEKFCWHNHAIIYPLQTSYSKLRHENQQSRKSKVFHPITFFPSQLCFWINRLAKLVCSNKFSWSRCRLCRLCGKKYTGGIWRLDCGKKYSWHRSYILQTSWNSFARK